jgi:hypothetical protein
MLLKQDLSVWQDIVALEGGRDWWSQIEDVLRHKALQHFVFVVTPAALASEYVRSEIRLRGRKARPSRPSRALTSAISGKCRAGSAMFMNWIDRSHQRLSSPA